MKTIAYKAFTAFSGIAIHDIEYSINNKIIYSYQVDGKQVGRLHKVTIYSTLKGDAYFLHNGRREFLKDYLKVNY